MSEADGSPPPPSYEDLVPTIQQYEIYYIYNVDIHRDYLPPSNQDNRSYTPTSISVAPTIILDSPPDYCELPPLYSIEDPQPQLEPLPPADYPPPGEPPPPYVGDTDQQVRPLTPVGPPPPNTEDSTQQNNLVLLPPRQDSCMTCSVINFILCPVYGIVPLVLSLMIYKGDIITATKYSSKVACLNVFMGFLTFCLYLMLCSIMVPILVSRSGASSSGSSASSSSISGGSTCC
ncbi:uncharacterized protein ACNLHF_001838 [Anomaloglossus baeobatrachus]|uniref:uncharacterized protein LOC142256549 n=1 Tax=Anomaloglossus baeobatrachus TaxID=238106 RepID=UPI003F4FE53A